MAASLRTVRHARNLSQHDLGGLAGVTASAISQAERAERSLSLATLVRLSGALGVTIDDLLRGERPGLYRIGRRTDDPEDGLEHTVPLLHGPDLRIDLVHLGPRESGAPVATPGATGRRRRRQRPRAGAGGRSDARGAPRRGARRRQQLVAGWRNLGQADAELFWIVY